MGSIELVLAMLLAVIVSGYLVRALPISLPLPIVQIVLGGVIAGVLHHEVELDPEVLPRCSRRRNPGGELTSIPSTLSG